MQNTFPLIFLGLLAAFQVCAASPPEMIVVCYPGSGSLNVKDANGAMSSMLRVVERVGQWPENTFTSLFAAKTEDCRQQMAEKNPKFAITSLGLYLELFDHYHLTPVSQPKIHGHTSERYRVMVLKDHQQSLEELKGKTLGGAVLEEQAFISKIVFAGAYDMPGFFVLKPTNQAIRALRSLEKGELDAVILNEQQYDALSALQLQTPLQAIFTSAEIPLMGVSANSTLTTAEERKRFGKALAGMCSDDEGKKLCELFGVESFNDVDPSVFAAVVKQWTEGK